MHSNQAMELIDAGGLLAAPLATQIAYLDNSHTDQEPRREPGVYASTKRGHAVLVGTNQRSLAVVDLVGVIEVAGIDVTDPDHLEALGDHFRLLAQRMRDRRTRTTTWPVPATQTSVAPAFERSRQVPASKDKASQPSPQRRTRRPSAVKVVDLLSLIEAQP